MSALLQLSLKPSDDVASLAFKLDEAGNNGTRFTLNKISENYERGNAQILLKLSGQIGGRRMVWICCVEQGERVKLWASKIKPRHQHGQFPMLGFSVQVVNYPEFVIKRVDSVIGLHFLDDLLGVFAGDELYFSLKSGRTIFVKSFQENGELDADGIIAPSLRNGEQPCEMIEARAEMMNDLSCDNRESQRNFTLALVERFLHDNLRIFITDDYVLAFLEERGHFEFEIADTLVGPF